MTSNTYQDTAASVEYDEYESSGTGWKVFAGIMILVAGTFNVIDGLVAVTDKNYFTRIGNASQLPVTNNIQTWGWVVLIWGTVLILAGFLIFSGNMFGRVVGVIAASGNAIIQLAFLPHFPFWSFTMILVDILVVWGLVVHGGRHVEES